MPKRTNDFQRLILAIYEQMAPLGATVEESAELLERGSSTTREVDILITHQIAGVRIRMAVECRGRKDKDDIEWIDGLIGKYRDLDIDKVIAVSKSGFTAAAQEKASVNRIEIRKLETAEETDWPAEFMRLGMAGISMTFSLASIEVRFEPPLVEPSTLDLVVGNEGGRVYGTLNAVLEDCFKHKVQGQVASQDLGDIPTCWNTLEDIKRPVELGVLIPIDNVWVLVDGQPAHRILDAVFTIRAVPEITTVSPHYRRLDDAMVTAAALPNGEATVSLTTIQVAGNKDIRIIIKPDKA